MSGWNAFFHILPTQALAPNGDRAHWAHVNRARRDLRAFVAASVRERGLVPERPYDNYELHLTGQILYGRRADIAAGFEQSFPKVQRPYRPSDPDGLLSACKPVIDALKDCGVISEDDFMAARSVSVSIMPYISSRADEGIGIGIVPYEYPRQSYDPRRRREWELAK